VHNNLQDNLWLSKDPQVLKFSIPPHYLKAHVKRLLVQLVHLVSNKLLKNQQPNKLNRNKQRKIHWLPNESNKFKPALQHRLFLSQSLNFFSALLKEWNQK